jgi:hypothetical protein
MPVAKPIAPAAKAAAPVAKPAPLARPAAPVKGIPLAKPAGAAKPALGDLPFPAPKPKAPPVPAKPAGKPGDIFANLEAMAGGKKPAPKIEDEESGGNVLRISEADLIDPPPDDEK